MGQSPSDAVPQWFAESLAPLVRVCRTPFTADHARDYYAILRDVHPRWLCAAVVSYLRTATEPWLPMPATLLTLARKAQREELARAIAEAPACEPCENTGLVTARPRGATGWAAFACGCVRGRQYRAHPRFDPQSMETWRGVSLPLPAVAGTLRLPDLSVPPAENKPAAQQVRELARMTTN